MNPIFPDIHYLAFADQIIEEIDLESDSDLNNEEHLPVCLDEYKSSQSQMIDAHAKEERSVNCNSGDDFSSTTTTAESLGEAMLDITEALREAKDKAQQLAPPRDSKPTTQQLCADFHDSTSSALSLNAQCA